MANFGSMAPSENIEDRRNDGDPGLLLRLQSFLKSNGLPSNMETLGQLAKRPLMPINPFPAHDLTSGTPTGIQVEAGVPDIGTRTRQQQIAPSQQQQMDDTQFVHPMLRPQWWNNR